MLFLKIYRIPFTLLCDVGEKIKVGAEYTCTTMEDLNSLRKEK